MPWIVAASPSLQAIAAINGVQAPSELASKWHLRYTRSVMKIGEFDPIALRREKQRARERDDRDLREGRVSAEELRARNGLYSGFDFSRARIRLHANKKRLRERVAKD